MRMGRISLFILSIVASFALCKIVHIDPLHGQDSLESKDFINYPLRSLQFALSAHSSFGSDLTIVMNDGIYGVSNDIDFGGLNLTLKSKNPLGAKIVNSYEDKGSATYRPRMVFRSLILDGVEVDSVVLQSDTFYARECKFSYREAWISKCGVCAGHITMEKCTIEEGMCSSEKECKIIDGKEVEMIDSTINSLDLSKKRSWETKTLQSRDQSLSVHIPATTSLSFPLATYLGSVFVTNAFGVAANLNFTFTFNMDTNGAVFGTGNLYLFTSPYPGFPSNLPSSSSNPYYVGVGIGDGQKFTFTNVYMRPSYAYYFYMGSTGISSVGMQEFGAQTVFYYTNQAGGNYLSDQYYPYSIDVVAITPSLTTSYLTSQALTTSPQTTSPMTTSYLTTSAVTSSRLTTSQLTSQALSTSPLTTQELTTSPLSTSQMTTSPLSTSQMTTSPLSTSQMTTSPLSTSQMTTNDLTTSPLTTMPVTTQELTTSPLTTLGISTSPLSTSMLTTSPLTTSLLTTMSITSQDLSTSPLTTQEVTTSPLTTRYVTTSPLSTSQMTTNDLTTSPLTTSPLTTQEITTSSLSTSELSTSEISTSPMTTFSYTTSPSVTSSQGLTTETLTNSSLTTLEIINATSSTTDVLSAAHLNTAPYVALIAICISLLLL